MPVEVDDEQWAAIQRLNDLWTRMSSDKEAKPHLERAVKRVAPNFTTQEEAAAELASPYVAQLEAMQTKFDTLQKSIEDERKANREKAEEHDVTSVLERVRAQYNYTDDGMREITDLMLKRKIADPEAAAALYERNRPAPLPEHTAYEGSRWITATDTTQADGSPSFKDWMNNTDLMVDREISRALTDSRPRPN